MAQTVLKCPHCKKNLGNFDINDWRYGSPLKVCPKCKNVYFDSRYHEIAVEGVREVDVTMNEEFLAKKRKSGRLTILGGVGVMVLFVLLLATGWIFYFFPVISIALIAGGIKTLKETNPDAIQRKRAELQFEEQQSQMRMQNPQYVAQLRSFGYALPAYPAQ